MAHRANGRCLQSRTACPASCLCSPAADRGAPGRRPAEHHGLLPHAELCRLSSLAGRRRSEPCWPHEAASRSARKAGQPGTGRTRSLTRSWALVQWRARWCTKRAGSSGSALCRATCRSEEWFGDVGAVASASRGASGWSMTPASSGDRRRPRRLPGALRGAYPGAPRARRGVLGGAKNVPRRCDDSRQPRLGTCWSAHRGAGCLSLG